MEERKAFDQWAQQAGIWGKHGTESAWEAWQAAIAAERERAAKVCERERMVRGGEVFAAEIRMG